MADTKISAMTNPSYLDGTEKFAGITTGPANISGDVYKVNAGALIYLNAAYTLTSTTAAQKLFNTTTNGTLTVGVTGLYEYEGIIFVSSMSATSGNAAFDLKGAGTATLSGSMIYTSGYDTTTTGAAGALSGLVAQTVNTGGLATVTAGTGTALAFVFRGITKITATGTLIPSIALSTAAAAVVGAGSWLRVRMVAPNAVYSIGNWS